MMGGCVEVKSVYGQGSVFTIYIPLVAGNPALVESNAGGGRIVRAKGDTAVLVVDDTPINLTVALGFLARHGIHADTAESGEEAVRMVAVKHYCLVFMDQMMPGMDGLEATGRIRALAATAADAEDAAYYENVPIIALSANAVQGARELFLEAGMNDFLSKPIEAASLNAVLARWLPEEKIEIEKIEGGQEKKEKNEGDALFEELRAIPGLDLGEGLAHIGGSRADYYRVLRQFCAGLDEGLAFIKADLEKSDWKDYTIRLHAYKGVFAILGQKQLSEWAKKLEFAGKELSK
jgi:CheY-like chemotaxis protein/HPt (histidine-containing phosphotransfer) domain-containing protein